MLKRLWYVLAFGWALLLLWGLPSDQFAQASPADRHFYWVLVCGPFFVPSIAARAWVFVRYGSLKSPAYRRFR